MSNEAETVKKSERSLTPKLRFPEFREEGEWGERKVGEVFKVTRGDVLAMPLVKDERTEDTPYPVYSSQTKNVGLVGYYSEYLYEDAITWTTDGANAGDVNYRPGKFFCTNVCGVLISDKGFANPCTAALINSVSRQHVSYVGNPKLMNGVMAKISVGFPPLPEQQKIAECLSSLDGLVAAEGRMLEALKAHKKGLMQQLFPQPGQTQPRLRFPEFRDKGEWEEKKLDELFHLQDGFAFKSTDFVKSKENATQVVRITDINNKNTNENKVFLPNAFLDSSNLNMYFVENGELLLSLTGAAGFNFFFWDGGRAVINQRTAKVTAKNKLDYALVRLLEPLVHEKINIRGEGQNNNLSKEFLSSVTLLIPRSDEQQAIADCLSALDTRIAAQATKIDALRTHKRGLMQQLFPAPEEP